MILKLSSFSEITVGEIVVKSPCRSYPCSHAYACGPDNYQDYGHGESRRCHCRFVHTVQMLTRLCAIMAPPSSQIAVTCKKETWLHLSVCFSTTYERLSLPLPKTRMAQFAIITLYETTASSPPSLLSQSSSVCCQFAVLRESKTIDSTKTFTSTSILP